jgi:ribosomal protein S12 methylthiotransferase
MRNARSVHFVALGCPKNLVDSEVMLGQLVREGFTLTDDPSEAGVIIVNTCAFIEDAKREAIDTILEMAREKEQGRCELLVVAGCLPQRYAKEAEALFPEVDLFVGAGEFPRIVEFLREERGGRGVRVARPTFLYDHETPRLSATPPHMAYIKIAEGCFHPCSFCVIPKIRGAYRSRDLRSVVEEARAMLARGVLELNLIAQDTTAYGRGTTSGLAALIRELGALPGEKWIRLLYAYPHAFPEGVIEAMRDAPGVCRYLDLPIQHLSDRVLRRMGRHGGAAEIRALVARLAAAIPGIWLRTSLIVGFPGETEEDFEELASFVAEGHFAHAGVFVFSPEEGTKAARLAKRVPAELAEERRQRLMEVQRRVAAKRNAALVGSRLRVLVEGPSEETPLLFAARHEGQAPEIDGVVYLNEGAPRPGTFAEVAIIEAHEYDVVGRVIE